MDKSIKCLVVLSEQVIISEIIEVGSELGRT